MEVHRWRFVALAVLAALGHAIPSPQYGSASAHTAPSNSRPLVWGVDLGNHNCIVATAGKGGVDVVLNDVAGRHTPSAVFYSGTVRLVGEHTTTACGSHPSNLVNQYKALLELDDGSGNDGGGAASDADDDDHDSRGPRLWPPWGILPYRLKRRGGALPCAVVNHGGGELEVSAHDVVGALLDHLRRLAEASRGAGVERSSCVVAGVPSHFTRRQRRAVLNAARIQGVPVTALMDEGTAVALAYGMFKRGLPSHSAMADMTPEAARLAAAMRRWEARELAAPAGGGAEGDSAAADAAAADAVAAENAAAAAKSTNAAADAEVERRCIVCFVDIGHTCTQVTVAAFTVDGLAILGRGCAHGCGAGTVERRVFDHLLAAAADTVDAAAAANPRAVFRLARAAAAAVKTLSANEEASVCVDCLDGVTDFSLRLTRAEVEEKCGDLVAAVEAACRQALAAAGVVAADVTEAELLGGGSYIPLLQRAVECVFAAAGSGGTVDGTPVRRTMNAVESVATGCALAAARHSVQVKVRPFSVADRLGAALQVSCRWRRRGEEAATAASGAAKEAGEFEIPRGASVPWATAVTVPEPEPLESGGADVLEVSVYEGVDCIAVYELQLPLLPSPLTSPLEGGADGCLGVGGVDGRRRAVSFQLHIDEFGDVRLDHAREETLPDIDATAEQQETKTDSAGEAAAAALQRGTEQLPAIRVRRPAQQSPLEAGRTLHPKRTFTGLLEGAALDAAVRHERALQEHDLRAHEAAEARNSLEDFVYRLRGRLIAPGGGSGGGGGGDEGGSGAADLAPHATAAEAASLLARVDEVEAWIYDGGADGSDKQAFEARLDELRELAAGPEARRLAFLEIGTVLDDLEEALMIREKEFRDSSEVLTAGERRRLERELATVQGWLTDARNRLESCDGGGGSRFGDNGGDTGAGTDVLGGQRYGSRAGRLPCTPAEVRRKLENLMRVCDAALASVPQRAVEGAG